MLFAYEKLTIPRLYVSSLILQMSWYDMDCAFESNIANIMIWYDSRFFFFSICSELCLIKETGQWKSSLHKWMDCLIEVINLFSKDASIPTEFAIRWLILDLTFAYLDNLTWVEQVVAFWFSLLSYATFRFFKWTELLSTWKGVALTTAALLMVTMIMHIFIRFSQSEHSTTARAARNRARKE